MSGEPSALIELGTVGAPFGVRGWVKLRSYTDPPDRLLDHRSFSCGWAAPGGPTRSRRAAGAAAS